MRENPRSKNYIVDRMRQHTVDILTKDFSDFTFPIEKKAWNYFNETEQTGNIISESASKKRGWPCKTSIKYSKSGTSSVNNVVDISLKTGKDLANYLLSY